MQSESTSESRAGRWVAAVVLAALLIPGMVIAAKRIATASRGVRLHSVQFARTVHDFGAIPPEREFHCAFRYVNTGEKPVVIQSLTSTCGCVATSSKGGTSHTHPVVLPGQTGEIQVTFNTSGMRPPSSIRKGVWVQFEHDSAPLELELRGQLRPEITVDPSTVFFPAANESKEHEDPSTLAVTIRRELLPEGEFASVKLAADAPYYVVTESARNADRVEYRVSLMADKAPAVLRPLSVHYSSASGVRTQRVNADFRRASADVAAVPKTYFVSMNRSVPPAELKDKSLHAFRLASQKHRGLKITGIAPRRADDSRILAWDIHPQGPAGAENSEGTFSVWLSRLPDQAVFSSVLMVAYKSGDGSVQGLIPVDVRVFAGGGTSLARAAPAEQ